MTHTREGGVLAWQWQLYPDGHRNRVALLLHAFAVPMFMSGCVLIRMPRTKADGTRAQRLTRAMPVMLVRRENLAMFAELLGIPEPAELLVGAQLSSNAKRIGALLLERGALFFDELVHRLACTRRQRRFGDSKLLRGIAQAIGEHAQKRPQQLHSKTVIVAHQIKELFSFETQER